MGVGTTYKLSLWPQMAQSDKNEEQKKKKQENLEQNTTKTKIVRWFYMTHTNTHALYNRKFFFSFYFSYLATNELEMTLESFGPIP